MAGNITNWIKCYKIEGFILFLGIGHQILQKVLDIRWQWFDNYGDDLLAVPFISSCVLIMENFLVYKYHQRKHSFLQLFFLFCMISIFFEYLAPKISSAYTFDYIDILFYLVGLIVYYLAIKKAN